LSDFPMPSQGSADDGRRQPLRSAAVSVHTYLRAALFGVDVPQAADKKAERVSNFVLVPRELEKARLLRLPNVICSPFNHLSVYFSPPYCHPFPFITSASLLLSLYRSIDRSLSIELSINPSPFPYLTKWNPNPDAVSGLHRLLRLVLVALYDPPFASPYRLPSAGKAPARALEASQATWLVRVGKCLVSNAKLCGPLEVFRDIARLLFAVSAGLIVAVSHHTWPMRVFLHSLYNSPEPF
jgi:hypothetical protein